MTNNFPLPVYELTRKKITVQLVGWMSHFTFAFFISYQESLLLYQLTFLPAVDIDFLATLFQVVLWHTGEGYIVSLLKPNGKVIPSIHPSTPIPTEYRMYNVFPRPWMKGLSDVHLSKRALSKFCLSWLSVMPFSCKLSISNNMISRAIWCK